MDASTADTQRWTHEQFGECELGDQRRTKRLLTVAAQVAENPSGSFPEQAASWGDLKGVYRLFDAEDVTFEAVVRPHWEHSRAHSPAVGLVLCDTTELDFGIQRGIEGLGPTGNGGGSGFLLHSALLVDAESEEVTGCLGQKIHYRKEAPAKENATQRLARERESEIWCEVCDRVGLPPEQTQWIHVCDRGGDNFELFVHLQQNRVDWVVRSSQLHRKVLDPQGRELTLRAHLDTLSPSGALALKLRVRPGQAARTAKLAVSFGEVRIPLPKQKSPYVKAHASGPIAMRVAHVREIDPPSGVEPLEWVLYTSLPVNGFDDAVGVVGHYENRWVIEEWHKGIKTGCRVTQRQLQTTERLEPMVGLMCVVAVRLLQLRSAARTSPERPALEVVPQMWVCLLCAARKLRRAPADMTSSARSMPRTMAWATFI
ncbi:MAG: IS4 family transposase [Planctomycetales bacterium]